MAQAITMRHVIARGERYSQLRRAVQCAGRTIDAAESGGIRLVRRERCPETEQLFVGGCTMEKIHV
jgi:hypothetical protein